MAKLFVPRILVGLGLIGVFSACQSLPRTESKPLHEYTVEVNSSQGEQGCKTMLDHYCTSLYSPEASGNLVIDRRRPIQILQGETGNQLSQVYVKYASAKIRNRRKLPADFVERLNQYYYFEKLDEFIHRTPVPKMTLNERMASEHLEYEIASIWQAAVDQTVVSRMSHKYRGYHQIPERSMPIEYDIEQKRVRRRLVSDVSRVLWKEDPNWHRVEDGFRDLKQSFLALFDRLAIDESLRTRWRERIGSIELVMPGALPEIADEECSKTTMNAFYYKHLNLITVCAGDFNSEDIILTLAHEMSHSLEFDTGLAQFLRSSELGGRMGSIREKVCSKTEALTCDEWSQFKAWLPKGISEMAGYQAALPEFNRCLKRQPTTRTLTEADSQRIGGAIANNRISNLAANNVFLRLIEEKLPMRSGKMQTNPNYMNPCGYYLWSHGKEPIDDELFTLVFFTAEYRCEGKTDQSERLKSAIETARQLSGQVIKVVIEREGEFSDRFEVVNEGFASSPSERFADVLGSHAVAQYLQKFNQVSERRGKYLASASWLCQEPSLESKYPEDSKIEQQFSLESHAQGDDRKMELLAEPIRNALQCNKDFQFNECHLPLRQPASLEEMGILQPPTRLIPASPAADLTPGGR